MYIQSVALLFTDYESPHPSPLINKLAYTAMISISFVKKKKLYKLYICSQKEKPMCTNSFTFFNPNVFYKSLRVLRCSLC